MIHLELTKWKAARVIDPPSRNDLTELEFARLLEAMLPAILNADITSQPSLQHYRPDFIAHFRSGKDAIIEAKVVTPNTRRRLKDVVSQLAMYSEVYRLEYPDRPEPELILAVPETFSDENFAFLHESGIDRIIDGRVIRAARGDLDSHRALAEPLEAQPSSLKASAQLLLDNLDATLPGKATWAIYQALCGDILSFLLCPPLAQPISESSNLTRVNRRDLVFPNYATDGFWEYMRSYYQAHYIVVDAKNYVGNVKKKEVLQLANYLSAHGVGLFGIITSRGGGDMGAEVTRREQWVLHRKLIVILNDDDLRQMISLRMGDGDPTDLIRQKIEDFRLGF